MMANFDGTDDVISITLPAWCNAVSEAARSVGRGGQSVLWDIQE
jgi:hypothetical protein